MEEIIFLIHWKNYNMNIGGYTPPESETFKKEINKIMNK